MKRKVLSLILVISMTISGCASGANDNDSGSSGNLIKKATEKVNEANSAEESASGETTPETTDEISENDAGDTDTAQVDQNSSTDTSGDTGSDFKVSSISLLGDSEEKYYDETIVPSVPDYKVAEDFSNVEYADKFSYFFDPAEDTSYNHVNELREALIKNSFAVRRDVGDEFFDIYESNRYMMFPNFITVDSLMHTYHLYFAHLMKTTEKSYLSERLEILTTTMLDLTSAQYEELKGTDFEQSAFNNLVFFNVGAKLLELPGADKVSDSTVISTSDDEYQKIMAAKSANLCSITGVMEDYTQYKPRGYYEGDKTLEKYFRCMMWYGRIPFILTSEEAVGSALLMTNAIEQDLSDWESIYAITSFFAGASDDVGYTEFETLVTDSYGKIPEISEITSNSDAFSKLVEAVKKVEPPKINSIPVGEDEENVIASFRFMGQRFTIDAAIMQQLVYRAVEEDSNGNKRMLPDTLDVAATLGSKEAYSILEEQGDTDYKNYTENMTVLNGYFNNSDTSLWNASLYSGWLNTLRPLFKEKGKGYPSYMQSEEWQKKDLETFAGSFAELKHDTILYAKQIMAEMGGGDDEEIIDDRGYVDPEPEIYSRFAFLSQKTKEGLDDLGMISESDKGELDKLTEISMNLLKMSEKELQNETLTDEEYELIRCYGGDIEHFWYEANKDDVEDLCYAYQAPCPVIADIATDPNGSVLEVGSGQVDLIYVVFPIDGKLHVGRGSVYSFYQFATDMGNRMTDSEWRDILRGGHYDDDWNWIPDDNIPDQPAWTQSYRID
ncbi:DUF3160 domain-containing protein [Butyrivibrio sp. WCD3002]|uniref:DUF3160 domain-containing protein n=1 Tax=Butyrivibrio sp. WCD3002 TaxID=1280676 RepID=UPI0004201BAC|nr:DUF3160 domain-containing protein [Butyrivibrio sp. WCD3002]